MPPPERPSSRSRVGPAHRLHRNGASGIHILLDERRRYLQCRGDVVESLGDIVGRQPLARVDLDGEEIANRVCVLLAIEPVQHDLIAQMRLARRLVERLFKVGDEGVECGGVWLSRAGRRHDAPTHLAYGLLEQVGMLPDALRRHALEAYACRLAAVVVTADTVLLERGELPLRRCYRGSSTCRLLRRGEYGAQRANKEHAGQCHDDDRTS
jgi:hypothetical protein